MRLRAVPATVEGGYGQVCYCIRHRSAAVVSSLVRTSYLAVEIHVSKQDIRATRGKCLLGQRRSSASTAMFRRKLWVVFGVLTRLPFPRSEIPQMWDPF